MRREDDRRGVKVEGGFVGFENTKKKKGMIIIMTMMVYIMYIHPRS